MIDLNQEYLASIRAKVCPVCIERTAEGSCGLSSMAVCPIEQYLPQILATVHSVEGKKMKDYVRALRTNVCEKCPNQSKGKCPFRRVADCPLNRYFALIVDGIDEVDEKFAWPQCCS